MVAAADIRKVGINAILVSGGLLGTSHVVPRDRPYLAETPAR